MRKDRDEARQPARGSGRSEEVSKDARGNRKHLQQDRTQMNPSNNLRFLKGDSDVLRP